MKKLLSEAGKEDLAIALLLLRDFKSDGRGFDVETVKAMLDMAEYLEITDVLNKMMAKFPTMRIVPKWKNVLSEG